MPSSRTEGGGGDEGPRLLNLRRPSLSHGHMGVGACTLGTSPASLMSQHCPVGSRYSINIH